MYIKSNRWQLFQGSGRLQEEPQVQLFQGGGDFGEDRAPRGVPPGLCQAPGRQGAGEGRRLVRQVRQSAAGEVVLLQQEVRVRDVAGDQLPGLAGREHGAAPGHHAGGPGDHQGAPQEGRQHGRQKFQVSDFKKLSPQSLIVPFLHISATLHK